MTHLERERRGCIDTQARTWWGIESTWSAVVVLGYRRVKVLWRHRWSCILLDQERRDWVSKHGQVDSSRNRAASLTLVTSRWMEAVAGICRLV